ncbi:LuxR C-terminal-related transcriptional regulator [Vibrio sp. ZSDE26]|uniref:LuxR C-terminal-related transcriptional regulator n=1 Tax=Vibrio amylolyticus TaxID=2847292 RepID=A0A9X1XMM3_9VIBR|nr:LuxR C-terminal-related transcriptional regulator [Vibrio amylolyticus]MCK6262254.1 LuxR C-terminal-related transcriptional regulator [Vibrio amylolyticus]
MSKADYTRTIYFLCEDKNADYPHVNTLQQALSIELPKIQPEDLMQANPKHRHKILLIDYQAHKVLQQQVRNLPITDKNFEVIIFNLNKRLTTDELLYFGNLKGLFYTHTSVEDIVRGLEEIINGQNWLPRKVASQLLHYYRHVLNSNTAPVIVDLTSRELQILRCLQNNSSNIQIADSLFISEFTVKSHLYQIFKKLSVKNRVQAIAWANQNLAS